jgi:S-adenosylmethionine:tRNA ribosyltransferase-isomerase
MKTEQLDYYLPPELIAQQPPAVRGQSRLLVLERGSGKLSDSLFAEIGRFLVPGDCLVLNDTKVLPARFFARRRSGGRLEGLFLADSKAGEWEVLLKGAGKIKEGESIYLADRDGQDFCIAQVLEKGEEGRCKLRIDGKAEAAIVLEKIGFTPLPPYIKRGRDAEQDKLDKIRYQTVYAREAGAVAAPTAGLHFTDELIESLKAAQVDFAYLTLHVGEGTFRPVTTETINEHKMHAEKFSIDEKNAQIINSTKEAGGRIIAVGTTSVRVLETVSACSSVQASRERGQDARDTSKISTGSRVQASSGTTELFIKPGYKFRMVDAMITNFHLPRSTLLALVAAFAGLENIMRAYRHAIERRYRFYSYGDTMLIT